MDAYSLGCITFCLLMIYLTLMFGLNDIVKAIKEKK